ncbi:hypothetical protein ACFVXE_36980 [Streptomyces sp. NPDC058231]|uniref:hypothetical protein n=1 Tax=Streptomyces sp. NPDC058231 TaxID=3346392 RepID=UPI0036EA6CBC
MRRTGTTRRSALTATGVIALGAALAGCGGDADRGGKGSAPAGAREAAAKAESTLRATAARASGSLLTEYEQVITAHPATGAGLAPLRDAVRAHTEALRQGGSTSPPSPGSTALSPGGDKAASPGTVPSGEATASASSGPAAVGARAAVKELAVSERRTADAHAAALLTAPPELARLLASIAAACAAHAYLLTELAKETSS